MAKRRKEKTCIDADAAGQYALPLPRIAESAARPAPVLSAPTRPYSNYVVYVDERGDHGLDTLDENYPVFVLSFCVFHKGHYAQKVVPAIETFKFRHFGHDTVVLHEHEIRKEKGVFKFNDRAHKLAFQDELTAIIDAARFILISCVIDKRRLRERAQLSSNPYHLALGFCLETLHELMEEKKQFFEFIQTDL